MENYFTISNTSTRTTFNSLKDVEDFVQNKKIRPVDGSNILLIEETIIKTHTIKLEEDFITKESFHKLIDALLMGLEKLNFIDTGDHAMHDVESTYIGVKKLKNQKLIKKSENILREIGIIDLKEFNEKISEKPRDFDWHHNLSDKTIYKKGVYPQYKIMLKELYVEILKWLRAEIYFTNYFKVVRLRTNYKPCNALGLISNGLCIGLRDDDVVAGETLFRGRNVSSRGYEYLTESGLLKAFKDWKI